VPGGRVSACHDQQRPDLLKAGNFHVQFCDDGFNHEFSLATAHALSPYERSGVAGRPRANCRKRLSISTSLNPRARAGFMPLEWTLSYVVPTRMG